MGLPLELLTMLVSTLISGWMAMKAKKDEAYLAALTANQKQVNKARGPINKTYQITRRWIALMSVFFIICFPKLVAVIWPDIGVTVGYHEIQQGFLFFTDDVEKVKWVAAKGLVITPLDSHLVAAIIGLYYGGKVGR